jgi:hypothetical protein
MTGTAPTPARPESDVFADLKAICISPGYIHAIAYFCWRDNLIRYSGPQVTARDLEHQYSHERLLRTEIATLIGLMVQQPVDMSVPDPQAMWGYVERTEALLQQLHQALMTPWFQNWDLAGGIIPEHDPFGSAAAMREPIFYAGESAYPFQYRDFARNKFVRDDDWLEANKGFRIGEACQMAEALGRLQMQRQLKHFRSMKSQPPEQWTMLPGFMFTAQDVAHACGATAARVERFLEAFSYQPHERNGSFTSLNEYNATNSAPILKTEQGNYILLQHYGLLEAVYEAPFYWMAADKAYSSAALTNRGRFTEELVASQLERVFGTKRVLRNIDIYSGKNRVAEADALVLYGDRAIVVQAKSKRLTIEARKGNDLQLKDDFKKAIQSAYDQAHRCAEALMSDGFRFVDASDTEIQIADKPRVVFPLCVVSDHYPALAFQARQFLKTTVTGSIQPPLVTDIFALDVFAEMLSTPLHFLNYLALRARFDSKLIVSLELTSLGYHLRHNLWLDPEFDGVHLAEDFTSDLDVAMLARRDGIPGRRTPKGTLTRFDRLSAGRILKEIEKAASPQLTSLGLLLLQLSSQTAKVLSDGIDLIVREARRDGLSHDFSILIDTADAGLTIHCNSLPGSISRERLSAHCRLRKHDAKAGAWYGLLLDPATGNIRNALIIEEDWKPDPQLDSAVLSWPKGRRIDASRLATASRKIGRNEPCTCGSGRKYKKCCMKV